MAEIPKILDGQFLRLVDPSVLRRDTFLQFGAAAVVPPELTPAALAGLEAALPSPELREEWRSRLAEEVLLGETLAPVGTVPSEMADWLPFGPGSPPLGGLLGRPAACAVVPLDTSDGGIGVYGMAHLWFFRDLESRTGDHRRLWEGMEEFLASRPGLKVFSVALPLSRDLRLVGESWRLAAELCLLAFDDARIRDQLARKWVVSGRVAGRGVILPVKLGNKLDSAGRTERRFLLPRDNLGGIAPAFEHHEKLKFAANLEGAAAHVAGRGVEDGGEVDWPDGLEVIHSLVSDLRETVLHSVLLMNPPPKKLVLWYSKKMAGKAEEIKWVLRGLKLKTEVELRQTDSGSPAMVERAMRDVLPADFPEKDSVVLFNVTNGNWLQRLAPALLARRFPGLWLIYRDRDNSDNPAEFTLVRYDGLIPSCYRMVQRHPASGIDWSRLSRFVSGPEKAMGRERLLGEITGAGGRERDPVLLGSTFPLSLVRRSVRISPVEIGKLRGMLNARGFVSFWGHGNTVAAAGAILGVDVSPRTARPALELDREGFPVLEGKKFRDCLVLSPEYSPGYRPGVGEEVPEEKILGWKALHVNWN